jgi:hypothetical protein
MTVPGGRPGCHLQRCRVRLARALSQVVMRDQVQLAEDFDELPDDIADAFGAR